MVREKSTEMILVRSLAFTQRQDGKLLDWENSCFGILWECGEVQELLITSKVEGFAKMPTLNQKH